MGCLVMDACRSGIRPLFWVHHLAAILAYVRNGPASARTFESCPLGSASDLQGSLPLTRTLLEHPEAVPLELSKIPPSRDNASLLDAQTPLGRITVQVSATTSPPPKAFCEMPGLTSRVGTALLTSPQTLPAAAIFQNARLRMARNSCAGNSWDV
jgi:hypothetical protein